MSQVEQGTIVSGEVAANPAGPALSVRVSLPATELAKVDAAVPARVTVGADRLVAPPVGEALRQGALTYELDGVGGR